MQQPIDIEALCAERGLRITEQRRIIAKVLSSSSDHPDVEKLHQRAIAIDPGISIATVYRTVRLFEDAYSESDGRDLDRLQYVDGTIYLPSDILVKVDIASMAHEIGRAHV